MYYFGGASMDKEPIGKITHFFPKISVAVIELSADLNVGDKISIEGATTSVEQNVDSMQMEHQNVESASSGDAVGLKVADKVRAGDKVYKIAQ